MSPIFFNLRRRCLYLPTLKFEHHPDDGELNWVMSILSTVVEWNKDVRGILKHLKYQLPE
jgi:hypothetical protein